MQHKKIAWFLSIFSIILLVISGIWLATALPANAQCGSQASSCKNCHEVQGQLAVNNDGTEWHMSHAFGDFCHICHAGNNQAMDITQAHTGMVAPLSDIKAGCLQCHPNDYQELAQGYADVLGVEIGSASDPQTGPTAPEPGSKDASPTQASEITGTVSLPSLTTTVELDVDDPNLVDFARRYDEIVLGKKTVNFGNAILIGLIGLVALGGGGFVIKNEKWLDFSSPTISTAAGEHPQDVVEAISDIAKLDQKTRQKIALVLKDPKQVEKTMKLLDILNEYEKEGGARQ